MSGMGDDDCITAQMGNEFVRFLQKPYTTEPLLSGEFSQEYFPLIAMMLLSPVRVHKTMHKRVV